MRIQTALEVLTIGRMNRSKENYACVPRYAAGLGRAQLVPEDQLPSE